MQGVWEECSSSSSSSSLGVLIGFHSNEKNSGCGWSLKPAEGPWS